MNFNFNELSGTSFVGNSKQYLKPFDIYKVTLSKIEKTTLKGKNDIEYSIVALEFSGESGSFSHNLFIPNKDQDFERRVNETSGTQYPSSFEQFQYTLMQILQVINPEGAKKLIENASKLKTIDQFIDLIVKGLTNKSSEEVFIKLVGRNVNGTFYASLPNACVLGKDATSETKPSALNFISKDRNNLNFSNYELNQMKAYKNAKPTNMSEETPDLKPEDELDIDDIEL